MKKHLALFSLCAVFAMTGCSLLPQLPTRSSSNQISNKDNSDHEHEFDEWMVTLAPSCTENGRQARKCRICGYVETEVIKTNGHDWSEWQIEVEPTCENEGFKYRHCYRCNTMESVSTPALGHYFVEVPSSMDPYYIEPTPYAPGQRSEQCERCGAINIVTIPMIQVEHNFVEMANRQDEGTPKTLYMQCTDCGICALRWDANEYNQELTTGSVTTKSMSDGSMGIRFGYVQYSNGTSNDPGTHIFYQIYSPYRIVGVGLSFHIQVHASAPGYAIFDNYQNDSNFGYDYNEQGELVKSDKRYGLRLNGQQVKLGVDNTEGLYSANQIAWIDWPVSLVLEQGINTFEFYGLGGYRPAISHFQINGFGPELLNSVDASSVQITNKEAFTTTWYPGMQCNFLLNLAPASSTSVEMQNGNLEITSSDPSVIEVSNLKLTALKAGSSTITVRYLNATDTVTVTVLETNAKNRYGVDHIGTAGDPLTNEEALIVAKSENYIGESYFVRGIIHSFQNAPGTRSDNTVSFYLSPATVGGERFQVYRCSKSDGSAFTDDDIWLGGEATAYGSFTKYNNQYETSSAIFVSCVGERLDDKPRETYEKTLADVLTIGSLLYHNEETHDYYKFQAYASHKIGKNIYLTATKGEELIQSKSDVNHGERDIYSNAVQLYFVPASEADAFDTVLLKNAKIEIKMRLANYYGTVENAVNPTLEDITVLEEGISWETAEPDAQNISIEGFLAAPNNKFKAYLVSGTIKEFYSGETKTSSGKMTITDGINDLLITQCTATQSALAWDGVSTYSYSNARDFTTNEITASLKIGDQVTLKLIRNDATNLSRAVGVIVTVG